MGESTGITLSLVDGVAPVLPSGALDNASTSPSEKHLAARVRFSETMVDAWNERRTMTFSLPDGVVFRGVEFAKFDRFKSGCTLDTGVMALNTGKRIHSTSGFSLASVTLLGGVMTIVGLDRNPYDRKQLLSMEFRTWLSIAADYSGDITLQASASPGNPSVASCSAVIAKAAPVVSIQTSVCQISSGMQGHGSDILLRESQAGALNEQKRIELWLGERLAAGLSGDVRLLSGASVAVAEGDLRIKNVSVRNGVLRFDIDRESSVPSLVVISGLSIVVDRSVPETLNDPLRLTVGGSAVAANSRHAAAFEGFPYEIEDPNSGGQIVSLDLELFDTRGISTPYLSVTTPGGS